MSGARVFGPEDWLRWLDQHALAIFGVDGTTFLAKHKAGEYRGRPIADDLASVERFIPRAPS